MVVAAGGFAREFQAERRGTVCGEDAPPAARREILCSIGATTRTSCRSWTRPGNLEQLRSRSGLGRPSACEPHSSEDSDLSPILRI